jgi:N-acyl homoserine lactone hydrolase
MNRILTILTAGASLFAGLAVPAQAASDVSLARFDCGTPQAPTIVNQRFSDTYAYGDLKIQFVFSCYLIKHGDDFLLWDTGHAMMAPNVAPKVSLVDYLAKIEVKPEQIKYVGISHYHADHTGQIASFPKATLLIGSKEWDAISSPKPAEGVNVKPFESWIKGESKVEPQPIDKDIFGDGTAIMLRTPGHTAGHSSLLVKLAQMGPVILRRPDCGFHRAHQENRIESEGDGHYPTRCARRRKIAGVSRAREVVAGSEVKCQQQPR